jgi:hypothetical protein
MFKEESPEDRETISAAGRDVYHSCEDKNWSPYHLPGPQVVYWAVEQAQGIIDNGGFEYFFENDWPKNPPYTVFIEAFCAIGAKETAEWMENVVEMFPFPEPHKDCKRRREYMESCQRREGKWNSIIDKLGNRVIDLSAENYTKLAAYIRANIDAFPHAKEFLGQK